MKIEKSPQSATCNLLQQLIKDILCQPVFVLLCFMIMLFHQHNKKGLIFLTGKIVFRTKGS